MRAMRLSIENERFAGENARALSRAAWACAAPPREKRAAFPRQLSTVPIDLRHVIPPGSGVMTRWVFASREKSDACVGLVDAGGDGTRDRLEVRALVRVTSTMRREDKTLTEDSCAQRRERSRRTRLRACAVVIDARVLGAFSLCLRGQTLDHLAVLLHRVFLGRALALLPRVPLGLPLQVEHAGAVCEEGKRRGTGQSSIGGLRCARDENERARGARTHRCSRRRRLPA